MKKIVYHNLLSEKSVDLSGLNKYVLVTSAGIAKPEIKKEIEKNFKVEVVKVNVANFLGKKKGMGKNKGQRPDFKKAIITLAKGHKIKEFEYEEKDSQKSNKEKSKK